jgi:L1 cell adhesion molecule like protein
MKRGTLYQLRNLINRRNVTNKVKSDVNTAEDFFELVVTGHIITSAMELLGMSSVDEVPSSQFVPSPEEAGMRVDSERKSILMEVASHIVDHNVDLSTTFADSQSTETTSTQADSVYAYSCETLTLGLLFLELKDGIREGDGTRVIRVWKYFLLLFKASNRKNYAIEALTLAVTVPLDTTPATS